LLRPSEFYGTRRLPILEDPIDDWEITPRCRRDDAIELEALSSQNAPAYAALIATRTTTHKRDLYDHKRRGR
jgi:hypothetical protein